MIHTNHRKKTLKTHSLTHPILKHPQNPKKLPPLLKGTDAQSGTTHKNPPSFTFPTNPHRPNPKPPTPHPKFKNQNPPQNKNKKKCREESNAQMKT